MDCESAIKSVRYNERGASLVEYAIALAVILTLSVIAIENLTGASGAYLSQTGEDIGRAPEHVADLEPSLPEPPDWIRNP